VWAEPQLESVNTANAGTAYCVWSIISPISKLNDRLFSFLRLFCYVPLKRDQLGCDSRMRLFLRLFCYVPLKRDQWDCDSRMRLKDTSNAIGFTYTRMGAPHQRTLSWCCHPVTYLFFRTYVCTYMYVHRRCTEYSIMMPSPLESGVTGFYWKLIVDISRMQGLQITIANPGNSLCGNTHWSAWLICPLVNWRLLL